MPEEVQDVTLIDLEDAILPLVSRPARYLPLIQGLRQPRSTADIEAVLAAPDLLEAAIMHPPVASLYHVLADAGVAVRIAFLPWIDLEAELRRLGVPLFDLELRRPLSSFDLVVIPLIRELEATGVIELLDLGGVPILAAERKRDDPLVIGAGPALANPEPFATFFDAVLVGDPETSLPDVIAQAAHRHHRARGALLPDRQAILARLAEIPGVYVPSLIEVVPDADGHLVAAPGTRAIRARYTSEMPQPHPPLQPLIEARSDVLEIEVMRGCPRHCRFCQPARTAGPLRELSPAAVLAAATRGVAGAGWDEVTLGGIMPADWSGLAPGTEALGRPLLAAGAALSLNAAAGETSTREVLRELSRVRRTTLAFAPEAGSERLRQVIGKPLDEEALFAAVSAAASLGWPSVKLHFMIGLPTETDDDLVAIADLIERVRGRGLRPGGRFSVQVMVHPFVPRAHTPFQWEGQLDLEEMRRRIKRLRSLLRGRFLRLRWGHPEAARLEALLARGDRRLGAVILGAYRGGARLDGWSEHFRPVVWWKASEEAGVAIDSVVGARDPKRPLAWSHLVLGAGEAEFAAEREAAARGATTPVVSRAPERLALALETPNGGGDLEMTGRAAGLEMTGHGAGLDLEMLSAGPGLYGRGRARRRPGVSALRRQRVRFQKTDRVRFISHLDVVRLIDRSLRRAGIGVAYSSGFSRHPRLSFGPPLPVGMIGWDEFFDVELLDKRPPDFVDVLNRCLPEGLKVLEVVPVLTKVQSLMSLIDHADYRLSFPPHARQLLGDPEPTPFLASLDEAIRHFLSHDRAYIRKSSPDGKRPAEIRGGVRRLAPADGPDAFPVLDTTLRIAGEGAVRPLDLAAFLLGEDRLDPRLVRIERRRLYTIRGDRVITPLEAAAGEELVGAPSAPAEAISSGAGRPDVQRDRHQRRSGGDSYRHSRRW